MEAERKRLSDPLVRVASGAFLVFLLIAADVFFGGLLTRLDTRVSRGVFAYLGPFARVTIAGHWLSLPGDDWWLFPVLAGAALALGQRRGARLGFGVFGSGIAGALLVKGLKEAFVRRRPYESLYAPADLDPFYQIERSASFPSGHVFDTVVIYALVFACIVWLAPVERRRGVRRVLVALWALLAVAMMAARVAAGVHWLSDTVASAAIGITWLALSGIILRRSAPDAWAALSTPVPGSNRVSRHNP